jgi:hypothetical protein
MCPIEVLRIALSEGLHEPRQAIYLSGRNEQMYVVRHQHIGVQAAPEERREFAQQPHVKNVIRFGTKTGASVVSPLNDVQGMTG